MTRSVAQSLALGVVLTVLCEVSPDWHSAALLFGRPERAWLLAEPALPPFDRLLLPRVAALALRETFCWASSSGRAPVMLMSTEAARLQVGAGALQSALPDLLSAALWPFLEAPGSADKAAEADRAAGVQA